eukprot:g19418.t1
MFRHLTHKTLQAKRVEVIASTLLPDIHRSLQALAFPAQRPAKEPRRVQPRHLSPRQAKVELPKDEAETPASPTPGLPKPQKFVPASKAKPAEPKAEPPNGKSGGKGVPPKKGAVPTQKGAGKVVPSGARFAMDVYGLESTLQMEGEDVEVHCLSTEPTFFGNYAPPDDLDGQIIDLVATRFPSSAKLQLRPKGLTFARDLARHSERVNRWLWRWIFRVQREASKAQVAGNVMAPDAVRQGERLFEQRPMLRPLLQCYDIVNLAPKLHVRRDWGCSFSDTGLLLAKKSLMEKYQFEPLNCAAKGQACELEQIYSANSGKPIVGAQLQEKNTGKPLANFFGVHAEKSKTAEVLRGLFHFAGSLPTLVVGDFNAVLRAPSAEIPEKSACWELWTSSVQEFPFEGPLRVEAH